MVQPDRTYHRGEYREYGVRAWNKNCRDRTDTRHGHRWRGTLYPASGDDRYHRRRALGPTSRATQRRSLDPDRARTFSPSKRRRVDRADARQLARAAGAFVVGIDPHTGEHPVDSNAWVRGIDEARSILPCDGADVVIDLSVSSETRARLLAAVRTGGQALLAGGPQTIDLDLYPDVHRRSLRVHGCDLSSACPGMNRGDADFIPYLLDSGRVVLYPPDISSTAAPLQSSAVTVRSDSASVMVVWGDGSG